jgi:SAM-dependent methyltransferase
VQEEKPMSEGPSPTSANADAFERERLGLLHQLLDPLTDRRLDRLGVQPGWSCLEVGAGDGSVARGLAARVGPQGQVVATDIDTRFLADCTLPNLTFRRHNILEDDLEPGHYDLVHCRAVLMHLADPVRGVVRMAGAVRPGGWLLLEELDALSFAAVDLDDPAAQEFDRIIRIIYTSLRTWHVMDAYIGRRLRGLIEQAGFVEVGHEGLASVTRGGEMGARFQQMNLQFLRPLVAAGMLTQGDVETLQRLYADPSFEFTGGIWFSAWGRRSAADSGAVHV